MHRGAALAVIVLAMHLPCACLSQTASTQIVVDPYTGTTIESGIAPVPVFESTYALNTQYYVECSQYWQDMGHDIGAAITNKEVGALGTRSLQLVQGECCCAVPSSWQCPRDRSSLKLEMEVIDTSISWNVVGRHADYTFLDLAFGHVYEMARADAGGYTYNGCPRTFVGQLAEFKWLLVIRAVAFANPPYPCPSDANVSVYVYFALYPSSVDILFQSRR
jgi:hypothetical protein